MKRTLAFTLVLLAAGACAAVRHRGANPYEEPPFYAKYLNTGSQLDAQITATLEALRADPDSPTLHNELGALLVQKNFPKDAAVEFERALDIDPKFYTAWYNLGLVRSSLGDERGAQNALEKTVRLKPGHPLALFQLGLNAEKAGDADQAIAYYAKAYMHNPRLLDVRVNPRILDSKLTHLALLKLYDRTQSRQSAAFQGPPAGYVPPAPHAEPQAAAPAPVHTPAPQEVMPALSPEAPPSEIVTPVPAATDPATQTST